MPANDPYGYTTGTWYGPTPGTPEWDKYQQDLLTAGGNTGLDALFNPTALPTLGGFKKSITPINTGADEFTTNTAAPAAASRPDPPRQNYDGSWEVPGLPGTWPTREAAIAATGAGDGGSSGGASPVDESLTTLPDSPGAMARMRALQMQGMSGLEALMARDLSGERKTFEDAMFGEQAEDINYAMDKDMRTGLEAMGGRNMLTSSVTGDYVLAPLARERASRLASARRNAITTAGAEQRADLNSQMQMLGQAFNSGTTGLQSEQNVNQANANRQTQVSEAEKNRTQQESQFGRSLTQQKELQESAFANAREIASGAALGAGISGGLSGLSSLFGPAIDRTLKGWGF